METAESEKDKRYLPPAHAYTVVVPQEREVLRLCEVYGPSLETRKMRGERGRTLYADALIENPNLGTLQDLCMRAFSKNTKPDELLPWIRSYGPNMRQYYDSFSIELPLEECYFIMDQKYWQRVVLADPHNKELQFTDLRDYDWRDLGLSMKFVEIIEACPADFFPEDEMKPQADLVKDSVRQMHIRHLESLTEDFFEEFFIDSDDSDFYELDSTDVDSLRSTPHSSIISEQSEASEEGSEGGKEPHKISSVSTTNESKMTLKEQERESVVIYKELREARRQQIEEEKEKQNLRRKARRERRERAEERNREPTPPPEPEPEPGKKKRKKKFRPSGVLDIPIEPGSDDDEDEKVFDRRNKELILKRLTRYDYPHKDCLHINLGFVRFFENLTTFTLEFLGPKVVKDYHQRHFRFSHKDIRNLAFGISFLDQLKTFRLRNSKMDAKKLDIIAKVLTRLPSLETVDFGNDWLKDDCGVNLAELFRESTSIKSVELEYNQLGENALNLLSLAIRSYEGTLVYLGLAGNPLGGNGLQKLCERIYGTNHVTQLCLAASGPNEDAIISGVANHLLRHPLLHTLDMRAVPVSDNAAVEMLKKLIHNRTIQNLDCRGCGFDETYQLEMAIIIKRNKFIGENPYVDNFELTPEELDRYIERIRNPIFARAVEAVKKRAECLENRPDIISVDSVKIEETVEPEVKSYESTLSLDEFTPQRETLLEYDDERSDIYSETSSILRARTPFVYDPNNFTRSEFFLHVHRPGRSTRFAYYNPPEQTNEFDDEIRHP